MFAPSREEARRFFFDTWGKYRADQTLSGLETTALAVMLLHAEYHDLLERPERFVERDYAPEAGTLNPFLHLGLHLAVAEQLSIDQPRGIAALYQRLLRRHRAEHEALHDVIECLGETLWQAQRAGGAPDERIYLDCLGSRAGGLENKTG